MDVQKDVAIKQALWKSIVKQQLNEKWGMLKIASTPVPEYKARIREKGIVGKI
jgi:hypothetical protein